MSTLHAGLDVGSTTVKLVVLDESFQLVYGTYKRHYSDIRKAVSDIILEGEEVLKGKEFTMMVTGSGGLSVTDWLDIPFIQEVVASTNGIEKLIPETNVAIELGGEDAKITYLGDALEQRMNSICAGGTGAFIDQMASLLETDAGGLNELAKNHKTIYSIASRCGVFAKTDVQALINQGISKEDIAASVLQAVVNQTISNLACGRPIKGNIAFLGGPLHFLSCLRERFIATLELKEEEVIYPDNSQLYVAIGAAISSVKERKTSYDEIYKNMNSSTETVQSQVKKLPPLFVDEEDYREFKERHDKEKIYTIDPKDYKGKTFLGIDAGSTTTKAVLLSEDNEVLYSYYGNNKGKPLEQSVKILEDIYEKMPHLSITHSCVTGYGEEFIKAGLHIDMGVVETMAHYRGSKLFKDDVDFILDIGGQDMKSMKIEDGIIDDILLNEACSSGCGSFIETFAKTVNMSVEDFVKEGLFAKNPVDLGSRCTVFMNSMVKQAQKEGYTVGDIAAGLSYSVIKNALQKVIKVRDPEKLGENIVVQGGTFYGDGILRAFEKISGRNAIRPNLAGLMGAVGASIIAKERYELNKEESRILKKDEINSFDYKTSNAQCGKCSNNCLLTVNVFSNGERYITGNRCERGAGVKEVKEKLPNLYDYKYERTFNYKSLEEGEAKRGIVGIPRVLNIYENYPFWHTFFTDLGYKVVLSKPSTRLTYEKGIASIPSETACYPAKISHGHILELIEDGIDFIFYPSIFYEEREDGKADNHLNCPVVAGYPELIKHNIEELKDENINFLNPFLTFDNVKSLKKELYKSLGSLGISKKEIDRAVDLGMNEVKSYKDDIRKKGEETIKYLDENNLKGIVLAGRPYHIDGAINHGIPNLINSLGLAVLTEDSIDHLGINEERLRVLDQWTYHSRLYRAAEYVSKSDNLELIQLNSFGCGLDAVTTDQVHEILERRNKIYTQLKIDEISNLGAATIRVRSLIAALEGRKYEEFVEKENIYEERIVFTEEDRKNHTIIMPQMAPIQFKILERVMKNHGYNVVVLGGDGDPVEEGLRYVNNDACYPSIIVIGQFIAALKSGKYDINNTSILMSQTGGVCRASNYIGFLRKALVEAGFGNVPVISVSTQGIETNPGFKVTYSMAKELVQSILLGDLLMRVTLRVRPYEKVKGSANALLDSWIEKINNQIDGISKSKYEDLIEEIVKDFDTLEITDEKKPRVGIVGEILVKYQPAANNELVEILEAEGAEAVLNDVTDFLLYCLYNPIFKNKYLGKGFGERLTGHAGIKYIEFYRKPIRKALRESERFTEPLTIEGLGDLANKLISLGNQSGEGWLLTAEMLELIEDGAENIVCVQPFGCLPNHITGKGMIKGIREIYPKANIIPLDYDPGASTVNQLNRLKLMLAKAKEQVEMK